MARTVVNVTASSTLDGRDISADGTKLDGIEANATADQTASEIKTLVEASSDIALAGNPTAATQSSGNNSTRLATTAFVTSAVAAGGGGGGGAVPLIKLKRVILPQRW